MIFYTELPPSYQDRPPKKMYPVPTNKSVYSGWEQDNVKEADFAKAFETDSLPDLVRRYEAGNRPNYIAYINISRRATPDKLEVFEWLLKTDFEDPCGEFWAFVVTTTMAANYAKSAFKIRPGLKWELVVYYAIHKHDSAVATGKHLEAEEKQWLMEQVEDSISDIDIENGTVRLQVIHITSMYELISKLARNLGFDINAASYNVDREWVGDYNEIYNTIEQFAMVDE